MVKKSLAEKKEKVLDFIVNLLENQSKNVIEFVKKVTRIREKVKKVVVAATLTAAGLIVVLIGIANYLSALFPTLQDGIMQIIVGLAAIITAVIYKKA